MQHPTLPLGRRLARLLLTALLCVAGRAALAAVVDDGVAADKGVAELGFAFGVAVDPLGNYYVVDQSKHRVVKFDPDGIPRKIIGRYGFGNGQLYGPQGIAVGVDSKGDTRVYVADTFNSRVVIFDDNGAYKGKFGANAPGGLNNPGGIAFLTAQTGVDGGFVFVADTRNHRVVMFADNGAFLREFRCPTCPANGIRPLGVSARLANGSIQIYVVDELTSVVQVINSGGGWVRSVGTKGTGKGQLASPHGMTVDKDGNVWVADSGFGTERISKFGPAGVLNYSFATAGTERLVSPKGVGLDQQGKIYIATLVESGGGGAFRYREEAPTLFAGLYGGDPFWVNSKGVWLWLRYNGIEQTCRAGGSASVRAPAGSAQAFAIDGGPITIDHKAYANRLKMDMTTAQATKVAAAWNGGKKIAVSAKFQARCQDGTLLQKTLTFQR